MNNYWKPTKKDMFFSFDGRIGRVEYFVYSFVIGFAIFLIELLADFVTVGLLMDFATSAEKNSLLIIVAYLFTGIQLALLWPALALASKRSHDLGFSGYAILLMLIPILNIGFALFLALKKGHEGENKFGPRSFETVLAAQNKALKDCPRCDKRYGLLDQMSQPSMCASCWKSTN